MSKKSTIELIRFHMGLTQAEMGALVDLKRATYRKYELMTDALFTSFLTYDGINKIRKASENNPVVLGLIDKELAESDRRYVK